MPTQVLEQAIASTRAILVNVSADQMGNDTPCEAYKVSDLINHIVGGEHAFVARLNRKPEPSEGGDVATGDYVAAFDEGAVKVVEGFAAPGALDAVYVLPFAEMPGIAMMGLAVIEIFQHGWDLAKATGQATDLAPELAAGILAQAKRTIPDDVRGPQGAPYGFEQTAPDGASNADHLAAFMGRKV